MAIFACIENERGEKLEGLIDSEDVLQRLLPLSQDDTFVCIRFIDPYGDTVFNHLQLPFFIAELERVSQNANTDDEKLYSKTLKEMAQKCLK